MGILGPDRNIFITGTGTSVGKTYFGCHLARFLTRKGFRVGVMKPIETGIVRDDRSDGALLKKAAKSEIPLEWVSPYRFKTPAAPIIASRLEKKKIGIPLILKKYHRLALDHDWMIVEGAGGLMVPILKGFYMADLILSLNLGVILIASEQLGTINHTLLSVHLAQSRGIKIFAIILNQRKSMEDSTTRTHATILRENVDFPVLTYPKKIKGFYEESFWEQLLI